MPNGKHGDNPLSDFTIHGLRPFPDDIMALLERIQEIGRKLGRWPLGENWPFSPQEYDWERGANLDRARELLQGLLSALEHGRGDQVLLDPMTRRPLDEPRT